MPGRSLPVRAAWLVPLVPAAAVAVVGGLTLRDHQLAAVALAATVAACVGASVAGESRAPDARRRAGDAAWRSAVWTVGVLLGLAGLAAIGGGWLAAVGGLAGLGTGAGTLLVRTRRRGTGAPAGQPGLPLTPATEDDPPALLPVAALSTEALGREWQRTAAALSAALEPTTRQHVVRRRQDTLDELERRDPEGFARWLTAGARTDSDSSAVDMGGMVRGLT